MAEEEKSLTTISMFELEAETKLTECDWRVLATVMDCEGAIYIAKHRGIKPYYEVCVRVNMTDKPYIEYIQAMYPAYNVHSYSQGDKHYRTQHIWCLSGQFCRNFLEGIQPFLIIKPKQAECCLELLKLQREWGGSGYQYPAFIKKRIAEIYQEIKRLNIRSKEVSRR